MNEHEEQVTEGAGSICVCLVHGHFWRSTYGPMGTGRLVNLTTDLRVFQYTSENSENYLKTPKNLKTPRLPKDLI